MKYAYHCCFRPSILFALMPQPSNLFIHFFSLFVVPVWQEAAELAGWEDEQIEFIREKVSEEGKQEDLKKGKAPEQVCNDKPFTILS